MNESLLKHYRIIREMRHSSYGDFVLMGNQLLQAKRDLTKKEFLQLLKMREIRPEQAKRNMDLARRTLAGQSQSSATIIPFPVSVKN